MNTFISPRSSLENHTRFQTKLGKVYTRSQTKRPKTLPFGEAHTYKAYIREYPLPPTPKGVDKAQVKGKSSFE